MLIDTDGRSEGNPDWFENEKTGAVYYNYKMYQGYEGTRAMTGEGWKWMGPNGMFTNGDEHSSNNDQFLVAKNGGIISKDKNTILMNMEMMLEGGKKSESIMNSVGYDKKPLVANVYSYERAEGISDCHGTVYSTNEYEKLEKVFSWTYVKKGIEGDAQIFGYYGQKKRFTSSWKTILPYYQNES